MISYSAVIYDTTGAAWTYTNPQPLAYVRQPISIDYSQGDMTVLMTGPPTGTQVVVVGAAELYGTETGVEVNDALHHQEEPPVPLSGHRHGRCPDVFRHEADC